VRWPGVQVRSLHERRPGLWSRRKTNRHGDALGPLPATGRTNGTREGWAVPKEDLRWVFTAEAYLTGHKPTARGTLASVGFPEVSRRIGVGLSFCQHRRGSG
jgi:hypothetical protein